MTHEIRKYRSVRMFHTGVIWAACENNESLQWVDINTSIDHSIKWIRTECRMESGHECVAFSLHFVPAELSEQLAEDLVVQWDTGGHRRRVRAPQVRRRLNIRERQGDLRTQQARTQVLLMRTKEIRIHGTCVKPASFQVCTYERLSTQSSGTPGSTIKAYAVLCEFNSYVISSVNSILSIFIQLKRGLLYTNTRFRHVGNVPNFWHWPEVGGHPKKEDMLGTKAAVGGGMFGTRYKSTTHATYHHNLRRLFKLKSGASLIAVMVTLWMKVLQAFDSNPFLSRTWHGSCFLNKGGGIAIEVASTTQIFPRTCSIYLHWNVQRTSPVGASTAETCERTSYKEKKKKGNILLQADGKLVREGIVVAHPGAAQNTTRYLHNKSTSGRWNFIQRKGGLVRPMHEQIQNLTLLLHAATKFIWCVCQEYILYSILEALKDCVLNYEQPKSANRLKYAKLRVGGSETELRDKVTRQSSRNDNNQETE